MLAAQEARLRSAEEEPPDPQLLRDRSEVPDADVRLYDFVRNAWHVLNPGRSFRDNWHIGAVCEHLEAVRSGQIRYLVINQPPRTSKTTVATVCFPAWVWIDAPWFQWLCLSHSEGLAVRDNVAMRDLIESPWYRANYPTFRLADDQNQKQKYKNDWGGHRIAFGMLSKGTGEGGDGIIFDDPMDRDDAPSEAKRKAIIDAFDQKWSTRMNDPSTGFQVVVMQRLHEQDVAGHALADLGFEHLCLPMRYEPSRHCVTSIGWEDPRKVHGELLDAGRIPEEEVRKLERRLGQAASGQLQQNPAPSEGNIVKLNWLRYWQYRGLDLGPVPVALADGNLFDCPVETLPDAFDEVLQSWDMAFKDKSSNSKVAGGVWARCAARAFLIDQECDHLDFVKSCEAVVRLSGRHPAARKKLVEGKANGPAIISALRGTVAGLIEVEPGGSKESRLEACAPLFQSGNVVLPHPAMPGFEWVRPYVTEIVTFPASTFNDQVDQTTQALEHFDLFKVEDAAPPVHVALPGREVYRPI